MKQQAVVSVIVPVYNAAPYLRRCVESIQRQTLRELEVLLVDDGSTDGSGALCDQLAGEDERITVLHKENGGSTSARNVGLRAASGAYVGFVDSDDWIEPELYETLLCACRRDRAEIAVCRQFVSLQGAGEYVERRRSLYQGCYRKQEGILPHHIFYSDDYREKGVSSNLVDKLFAAALLKKYQFSVDERTKFAEDDLCVYACLLDAEAVTFLDRPFYHYCRRTGSVTRSEDREYFAKINLFYCQMRQRFASHQEARLLHSKLDRYMLELLLRGINWQCGFGWGDIISFWIPPYRRLNGMGVRVLALYGAGDMGRAYYRAFRQTGAYDLSLWVDQRWEERQRAGLPVEPVEMLRGAVFDAVLIAVESEEVQAAISRELEEVYGIPAEKIVAEPAETLLQSLERM